MGTPGRVARWNRTTRMRLRGVGFTASDIGGIRVTRVVVGAMVLLIGGRLLIVLFLVLAVIL